MDLVSHFSQNYTLNGKWKCYIYQKNVKNSTKHGIFVTLKKIYEHMKQIISILGILISMKTMAQRAPYLKCIGTRCCADTLQGPLSLSNYHPITVKQNMLKEGKLKTLKPKCHYYQYTYREEIFPNLINLMPYSQVYIITVNSFPSQFSSSVSDYIFGQKVVLTTQPYLNSCIPLIRTCLYLLSMNSV